MAQYFFDTSALVNRYHQEDGTEAGKRHPRPDGKPRPDLYARRSGDPFGPRNQGSFGAADTGISTSSDRWALADLASGRIKPYSVTDRHFADAERMVRQFSYDHRLRSLDAIQLSVALDLRSQGLADSIVTADQALQAVASLLGLAVLNPQDRR